MMHPGVHGQVYIVDPRDTWEVHVGLSIQGEISFMGFLTLKWQVCHEA